jgi:hypothetical protein
MLPVLMPKWEHSHTESFSRSMKSIVGC